MKTLRQLRQERAEIAANAAATREKARANLAAGRTEGADRGEIEKKDDAFKAELRSFATELELLDADIVEAEKAAAAERSAPAVRSSIAVAEGFEKDPKRGFATPRDFLLAVMHRNAAATDPRLRFLAAAGSDEQSGASDSYGGFLVPEAFSPNLLSIGAEADPTAALVRDIPMAAPRVALPARTDKNHQSSVTGGLTVARREETVAGTASRMQIERVNLVAHSLFGLAYATEEILTDSPISFAALLASGFADEFRSRMLHEKLLGTGVGEFQGVIGHAATVSVAAEGGQTADTINGTNILKMRARQWRYGQSIWLANHDTLPQLCAAHVALTNGSVALFAPGNGTDKPDTLLGRPIYFTEYCPTLGDVGDLVNGCWSEYLVGTLQSVQSAESIHVRFVEHERTFKFWMRNDGQPWWRSTLTVRKGANALSPFVTLAAR